MKKLSSENLIIRKKEGLPKTATGKSVRQEKILQAFFSFAFVFIQFVEWEELDDMRVWQDNSIFPQFSCVLVTV